MPTARRIKTAAPPIAMPMIAPRERTELLLLLLLLLLLSGGDGALFTAAEIEEAEMPYEPRKLEEKAVEGEATSDEEIALALAAEKELAGKEIRV